MKLSKKIVITGVLCAVIAAGTLGGFAIASANDEDQPKSEINQANMMEKVAEIYEKNTGVAIDSQELQKAFEEAGNVTRTEMCNQFLQKLIDEGKITREQGDAWKAWLDARPDPKSGLNSDEFKAWMQSRPEIPGLFGDNGPKGMMPFGGGHRGPGNGGMGFGFRGCLPDSAGQ